MNLRTFKQFCNVDMCLRCCQFTVAAITERKTKKTTSTISEVYNIAGTIYKHYMRVTENLVNMRACVEVNTYA